MRQQLSSSPFLPYVSLSRSLIVHLGKLISLNEIASICESMHVLYSWLKHAEAFLRMCVLYVLQITLMCVCVCRNTTSVHECLLDFRSNNLPIKCYLQFILISPPSGHIQLFLVELKSRNL